MNEFVKSHGLGNDYIVIDKEQIDFELDSKAIRMICDRNYGVGSDGILLLTSSGGSSFNMKILNPDGSEAEKSGNGLRIFAKFLYEHGYTRKDFFDINTAGGIVKASLEIEEQKVKFVTVDMGTATFRSSEIPVEGEDREVVGEELRINGEIVDFTAVSMGNPHCVVFREDIDEAYIKKLGPIIENHRIFPNRVNVQFASVADRNNIDALIWERGAGYTLASGSSSCAVAAAAVKNDLADRNVVIRMPGGNLEITVGEDWGIKMRGGVDEVFTGKLSEDFLANLKR